MNFIEILVISWAILFSVCGTFHFWRQTVVVKRVTNKYYKDGKLATIQMPSMRGTYSLTLQGPGLTNVTNPIGLQYTVIPALSIGITWVLIQLLGELDHPLQWVVYIMLTVASIMVVTGTLMRFMIRGEIKPSFYHIWMDAKNLDFPNWLTASLSAARADFYVYLILSFTLTTITATKVI